ncbi:MAG: hypothetical protein PHT41_02225 [Candidatus Omnitrophica bacterium]|nr:hypothetical protein [Candidatus Omnitrophota bacterium]MDD5237639.1 hypothetical protein [Candidatus Omnitrophota bacterium]
MACFLVPTSTAIVTTVIRKKIPEKYHINWLNSMLWGGVVMLAVEHISHGEIVLYPPFLTAGLAEVFPEMLRVGVPMTLSIFLIWGIMVTVAVRMSKKAEYVEA